MAKALQRRFGWNARDLATGAHPRSPSKYSPLAGVSVHGRIFTPESTNNFPVGEGMAIRGRGETCGTERSLLPYDEDYEEEEEGEEVDALLGLKEEEFGPAYEPAHASSVSVLGHEGDGRPIRHVYTMQGQTVTRKGRPTPQQLSELDESIWREELPRLRAFVQPNNDRISSYSEVATTIET
ncbi:hypothetical protein FRC17_005991 [Serendipita sp. 399]|nr:hypothetical protein FRC17_005991 [Serendipita sp. 399]